MPAMPVKDVLRQLHPFSTNAVQRIYILRFQGVFLYMNAWSSRQVRLPKVSSNRRRNSRTAAADGSRDCPGSVRPVAQPMAATAATTAPQGGSPLHPAAQSRSSSAQPPEKWGGDPRPQ